MRAFLLALILSVSTSADAIQERDVLTNMINVLENQKDSFYTINFFETRVGLDTTNNTPNLKIYYTKFGAQKGPRGSVVIVPGRTESSLKYIEVATDFINRGYSPVYALDHRGQGFSPTVTSRKLPDMASIGHVEHFDHYIKDFETFVSVTMQDPDLDPENLFLVSNSMGGAIAMRYFQKNPTNPFKKAALSGSMFKIVTDQKIPLLKSTFVCHGGFVVPIFTKIKCYDYTPGESAFAWFTTELLPDGRTINAREFVAHGDRSLTSSRDRFLLNDFIFNKWPQTIVGGPSLKWTEQALLATKVLRLNHEIRKVRTPFFLLIAKNDFRADPATQENICRRIGPLCISKTYDSYHEILMETDSVRDQAMSDIFRYFEN